MVYIGIRNHRVHYVESPDAYEPKGTGLIVGKLFNIGFKDDDPVVLAYLVTAKHVISEINNLGSDEVYLRFNRRDDTAEWYPTRLSSWLFHPTNPQGVDVAVLPLKGYPQEADQIVYPFDEILSRAALEEKGFGLGDEVFVAGLFWHHFGKQRNIPIIRTGSIAAMPEEPIEVKGDFGAIDAFLIEMRSVGGISGSPVFAYLGDPHRESKRESVTCRRSPSGGGWPDSEFYMLGLIHGHFDANDKETGAFIEESEKMIKVNVGIAIVVPGDKIIEVLTQPKITDDEQREIELLKLLRKRGAINHLASR